MEEDKYLDRLDEINEKPAEDFEEPELEQDIDEFWKPEIDESVKGVFLGKRKFTSQNPATNQMEEFYVIILLVKKDGNVIKLGVNENTFLKQRLHDVQEGDGVSLTYLGKKQSKKSAFKYNAYNVGVIKYGDGENSPETSKERVEESKQEFEENVQLRSIINDIRDQLLIMDMAPTPHNIIMEARQMAQVNEIPGKVFYALKEEVKKLEKTGYFK